MLTWLKDVEKPRDSMVGITALTLVERKDRNIIPTRNKTIKDFVFMGSNIFIVNYLRNFGNII
jgi:hypothetical protein